LGYLDEFEVVALSRNGGLFHRNNYVVARRFIRLGTFSAIEKLCCRKAFKWLAIDVSR